MKIANEIQQKLTKEFLIKTSQKLIQFYKNKQHAQISQLFSKLFPKENETNFKKMFYKLIKIYHPDSIRVHIKALNNAIKNNSENIFSFFQNMVALNIPNIAKQNKDYEYEESYEFEKDEYDSHFYSDTELTEEEFYEDIISLISNIFLGNSSHRLEPVDLSQIDAELVLSERNISNLDGLQYCTNLHSLDLSNNDIDNLFEIKNLNQLEELDLSNNSIHDIDALKEMNNLELLYLDNNQIEDISPLLKLESLKLVSIVGNPITSMKGIRKLQAKDVVVIYY